MQTLDGQVALVTGASRGIGAATAIHFAQSGAKVVLAARTLTDIQAHAETINESGGTALAVACDVANYENVAHAISLCESEFGGLDILVNNAGVIEPVARLADSSPEEWCKAADINYKGVYFGLRAAIPAMLKRGSGVIVNISSGAATSAMEGWSHYCSSKAAALALTRCADKEYGEHGIRVVGLSPGTVATEMQVQIRRTGVNPVSQLDPSVHIPPEWVAQAIAWLCTDDAGEFAGGDVALRDPDIRRRIGLPAPA